MTLWEPNDAGGLTSYGIGDKNNDSYRELMEFFIRGNEESLVNLIKYLEAD